MYICICKAVTDHDIRSAVRNGTSTIRGLRNQLGCTGQCGKCKQQVREIRDDVLGEQFESGLSIQAIA